MYEASSQTSFVPFPSAGTRWTTGLRHVLEQLVGAGVLSARPRSEFAHPVFHFWSSLPGSALRFARPGSKFAHQRLQLFFSR